MRDIYWVRKAIDLFRTEMMRFLGRRMNNQEQVKPKALVKTINGNPLPRRKTPRARFVRPKQKLPIRTLIDVWYFNLHVTAKKSTVSRM